MNNSFILIFILLLSPVVGMTEDLGMKNKSYAIGSDARDQLKDVMREKQKSGQIDRFWNDYRDKTIDAIKNPAPLGVRSDLTPRIELHTLKFIIPQDYKDNQGRVVVKRGVEIEPLKIQPLVTGLIFIDGRDPQQVSYAIERGRREPLKIVLTAGSPFALRTKYKKELWNGSPTIPFYFDQRKMIINQLKQLYGVDISSVPAKLSQKGTQLQIEFGMRQ